MKQAPSSLIRTFAAHPVAANLLMLTMMLVGIFAILKINTQFLPTFNFNLIRVQVVWPGANAEDVERSITIPIEQELRRTDYLKKMDSLSRAGVATITLEMQADTDMSAAVNQVREFVSQVRNLPADAEQPIVNKVEQYETVARLVVTTGDSLATLRPVVYQIERELLDRGIAKVGISGLPEEEIRIEIPAKNLSQLNLSLTQLAQQIRARSEDSPAGTLGKNQIRKQLRAIQQKRTVEEFKTLLINNAQRDRISQLQSIASIYRTSQSDESKIFYQGQPAVVLALQRTTNASALKSANILHAWLQNYQQTVGNAVDIHVYDQRWQLIKERIMLLVKNGLGGLLLIILVLFLFLNFRIAWWVIVGIPTSFLAALGILYFLGGSINMVSLFAIIMTLGIIVDDTIVISEETLTQLSKGKRALDAAVYSAHKMLAPILSSSLTTICAFLPLFLISGIIGQILFDIPLIVTCVIIASIVECFLVLPGHLHHSNRKHDISQESSSRQRFNQQFEYFKHRYFRKTVVLAIKYRGFTLSCAFGLFIIAFSLIKLGYIAFSFFPSPEGRLLYANIQFAAGTQEKTITQFTRNVMQAAKLTNQQLSNEEPSLITTLLRYKNRTARIGNNQANFGPQYAAVVLELTTPDSRTVRNQQFIDQWQKNIILVPGIDNFSIRSPRAGPPGLDIEIKLSGTNLAQLKHASQALKNRLAAEPGVFNITDNIPYGQEQLVYQLNSEGKALGLTIQEVNRQLRAAFSGVLVQVFYDANDEVEVRLSLPDKETDNFNAIRRLPIISPSGRIIPLEAIIDVKAKSGFDIIRHTNTKTTIDITAEVNADLNNENTILANLKQNFLPKLANEYSINFSFAGRSSDQQETLQDMLYGLMLGLVLIYIILAWVFASYLWPIAVMLAIPLGLTGAILGHGIMGINLTILSLFGFFGLSGIVVNDSIILINTYKRIRKHYKNKMQAIIRACCLRLRAVLVTSVTTIVALAPLLLERSLQAQFLIPMAVSITFGLAYATLLILFVVPCLLSYFEQASLTNVGNLFSKYKGTDKTLS